MDLLLHTGKTVLVISLVIGAAGLLGNIIGRRAGYRWRKLLWFLLSVWLLFPVSFEIDSIFPEISPYQVNWGVAGETALQSFIREKEVKKEETLKVQPDKTVGKETDAHRADGEKRNAETEEADAWSGEDQWDRGNLDGRESRPGDVGQDNNEDFVKQLPIWQAIGVIWAVGAVMALYLRVLQYRYIKSAYLQDACERKEGDDIVRTVREKSREFGIRKNLPVFEQENLKSPMLFGYLHPAIYLPVREYEGWELEAVIRHELTHYKKRDLWFKLLLMAVSDIYWFNPAVRLMKKMAFGDMELVCDEYVTRTMDAQGRRAYGNAILNTMRTADSRTIALSTQFMGSKKSVKIRLENLFTGKKGKWGWIVAALLVLAALSGTMFISVVSETNPGHRGLYADNDPGMEGESGLDAPGSGEKVYVLPEDCSRQTFYGDTEDGSMNIYEPKRIAENVVHVDSNDFPGSFTIFLTKDGKLYGMGVNGNGLMEAGTPEELDDTLNPERTAAVSPVQLMENVRYARCGMDSIVALKEDGSVWYWGDFLAQDSASGAQSAGNTGPRPVKVLEDAVFVNSGAFTMGAIGRDCAAILTPPL